MVEGTDAHTRKRRGFIVVDSSTLFRLAGEVPFDRQVPTSYQHTPPRYCDILKVLGRSGYEIIIPEMVSMECAQLLAGGLSPRNIFDRKNPRGGVCRDFLRDAALGNLEGVHVVRHDSDTPASRFCNQVRLVTENAELGNQDHRRRMVMRAYEPWRTLGKDQGENQAFEIMQTLDAGVPLFYLTEDIKSHAAIPIALRDRISLLNLKGLLRALDQAGFLSKVGLKDDIPGAADDHFRHACLSSVHEETKFHPHALPAIDRPFNGPGMASPFRKSLDGVPLTEVGYAENQEVKEPYSRDGPSQMEKFLRKWKRNEATCLPGDGP